jgi:hypothetical protein
MTKSEFYKKYYTRLEGQSLNEQGYPNLMSFGELITTEAQWNRFLETEIDLPEFFRLSKDACDLAGIEYVPPYTQVRQYPEIGEQLDGIYKSLLTLKQAGINIGPDGDQYVDSITAIKTQYPKN